MNALVIGLAIVSAGWAGERSASPPRTTWAGERFERSPLPARFASATTQGAEYTISRPPVLTRREPPVAIQPRWHVARDYPGWQVYGAADPVTGWITVRSWRMIAAPPAYQAPRPMQRHCTPQGCSYR